MLGLGERVLYCSPMEGKTRTILLRGGPADGYTVGQVAVDQERLDYMGATYVRTDEEAPRRGDNREVQLMYPVYAHQA